MWSVQTQVHTHRLQEHPYCIHLSSASLSTLRLIPMLGVSVVYALYTLLIGVCSEDVPEIVGEDPAAHFGLATYLPVPVTSISFCFL